MTKIRNIIMYSLIGAIGFGLGGAILGTIEDTDSVWYWLLGLALIGIILGAVFAFLSNNKAKLTNFAFLGAAGCAGAGYFAGSPDFDLWMKLAIIGLGLGATIGLAFAMYDNSVKVNKEKDKGKGKEKNKNTVIRDMRCDECKGWISKDDSFCPNCGTEFDE